jgi:ribosomal protein S18 acetylase RimI-like enzyme
MEFKIIQAKNPKEVQEFYNYFSLTLSENFPHYTKKTIKYFTGKAFTEEAFWKDVKTGERKIYLAVIKNKIVGYLVSLPSYGGIGFCNWVAVDKNYRGLGIASALLDIWEKDALEEGAHKLELWTDQRNISFYKKRGFELLGKIPDNYFGKDDYLFYKTLRKSSEANLFKR